MGSRYEYRSGECTRPLPADGVLLACVTRVSSSSQGHGGSGTIQDHHQAVLQARAGDLGAHCGRHGWQVASLTPLCVQGIIFVYDVTHQPSFQHLAKWVSDVDEVGAV